MKIKMSLTHIALTGLMALMSACGSNTNSISANSNNPGAGALGANVDQKNCQVNQVYSADYGCLNASGCGSASSGFSTQLNRCVQGTVVTEEMKFGRTAMSRHYGRLTVTNTTQMELMLQQAGLCNSNYGVATSNVSSSRCAAWISRGAFLIVKSYNGALHNVNMQIGAGTQFPMDLVTVLPGIYGSQVGLYNQSGYGSSNYVSFSQMSHKYSFNNGNGMQIVGVNPSNEPLNLMLLVTSGNLGIEHFEGQLVYQGVTVATIPMDKF